MNGPFEFRMLTEPITGIEGDLFPYVSLVIFFVHKCQN